MPIVNITELRNHLAKYLEKARKGAEILITARGNVIARIVPPINMQKYAKQELKKLQKKCNVLNVISPINEEWNAKK